MLQIKEHDKNLKEQLNEEKIDNLAEKEFRVMIVKMIQVLRNRMELWIEKIQAVLHTSDVMKNGNDAEEGTWP